MKRSPVITSEEVWGFNKMVISAFNILSLTKKNLSYRLFVFPNVDGQKQWIKRFVISMQDMHRVLWNEIMSRWLST